MSVAIAALPAVSTLVIPAAAEPYTPTVFLADLTAGVGTILPWVGAAVGAGIGLMFIFMGIRKGLQFFKGVAK
jgi:hypothetical protein